MPKQPKMALMRKIKAKPMRKMEPLEPLPTKDDYMDDIDSELSKYEKNISEIDDVSIPEMKDMDETGYAMNAEPITRKMMEPMEMPDDLEPLPYEEYIGPGSPRRKRYEEQMQTEKDAAPMRTLRAAKEGFIEGAKEGVSNIKKAATAVAEGTGIPAAYRTARSAIKSVGKMASGTNRAKGAAEDPAIKELSDMMSAGVITEGDLTRYRKAMQSMKGSKK